MNNGGEQHNNINTRIVTICCTIAGAVILLYLGTVVTMVSETDLDIRTQRIQEDRRESIEALKRDHIEPIRLQLADFRRTLEMVQHEQLLRKDRVALIDRLSNDIQEIKQRLGDLAQLKLEFARLEASLTRFETTVQRLTYRIDRLEPRYPRERAPTIHPGDIP